MHAEHFDRYRRWYLFAFALRSEALVPEGSRPVLPAGEAVTSRRVDAGEARSCPFSLFHNEAAVGVFGSRPPTCLDHPRAIRRNVCWAGLQWGFGWGGVGPLRGVPVRLEVGLGVRSWSARPSWEPPVSLASFAGTVP